MLGFKERIQGNHVHLHQRQSVRGTAAGAVTSTGATRRRTLGERRSPAYMDAVRELDVAVTPVDVREVAAAVRAEFGPRWTIPAGLLARCFLGPAYDVHILSLAGDVVEHFHPTQALPEPFARARRLALHDAYVAIEVYPDRCVCLRADGGATEVPA